MKISIDMLINKKELGSQSKKTQVKKCLELAKELEKYLTQITLATETRATSLLRQYEAALEAVIAAEKEGSELRVLLGRKLEYVKAELPALPASSSAASVSPRAEVSFHSQLTAAVKRSGSVPSSPAFSRAHTRTEEAASTSCPLSSSPTFSYVPVESLSSPHRLRTGSLGPGVGNSQDGPPVVAPPRTLSLLRPASERKEMQSSLASGFFQSATQPVADVRSEKANIMKLVDELRGLIDKLTLDDDDELKDSLELTVIRAKGFFDLNDKSEQLNRVNQLLKPIQSGEAPASSFDSFDELSAKMAPWLTKSDDDGVALQLIATSLVKLKTYFTQVEARLNSPSPRI